jgi:trehalose 6-phosphate synthase/phosphatase
MDAMHPDPDPAPLPSLADLREQVARLEATHRERGLNLSGRIIHVCHHLPVEIVRIIQPTLDGQNGLDGIGGLSSPITPEFKPEDTTTFESKNAKWKIHSRRGHTAMVSGIRSLSTSHEQLVVAWSGDVLLQPADPPPTPPVRQDSGPKLLLEDTVELHARVEEPPMMVFHGEFSSGEQQEIESELHHFSELEAQQEPNGKLTYVPVFLPPDVSKGHYEGYCKTSRCAMRQC